MQTTGTRAETAELNKKSDTALAKGYEETVKSISKVLDGLDLLDKYGSLGYVSTSVVFEKSEEAQDAGATSTNKKVMKLAQENLKTERNNLKTLSAQSAVTAAESSVRAAETKLDLAKMSFNFLLGYPVMQEVDFTDSLDVVSAPAIDLNDISYDAGMTTLAELQQAQDNVFKAGLGVSAAISD